MPNDVSLQTELFHVSCVEVCHPNLKNSRLTNDFGSAFYLVTNEEVARGITRSRSEAIINVYKIIYNDLHIKYLHLNKEWLDYVLHNIMFAGKCFDDNGYDIIIGPMVDADIMSVLELYDIGFFTAEEAISKIEQIGFSIQIAIKTDRALEQIHFLYSKK